MRFWGKTIRRWRWEWLAVLAAILFYGSCGYGCATRLYLDIPAEESKIRFDSRIAQAEECLHGYDVDFDRYTPWSDMRYSRRIGGTFTGGSLYISLENEDGAEKYILKIAMDPGETPEQSLPDAASVQMACEVFSVLTDGEDSSDYSEDAISWLLDDAR